MKKYKDIFNIKDKTVIINGGLGTIGNEVSQIFLYHGAKIIIFDKDEKKSKVFLKRNKLKKNKIQIYNINTSEISSLEFIQKKILKKIKVNVFVNCSYPRDNQWIKNSFENIKYNSLIKNIELNANNFLWLPKIIGSHMIEKKIKGSIIQIGSIYGSRGQNMNLYNNTNVKNNFTYPFVKGGLINMTKQMASYYAKYNIRVNCISPGGLKNKIAGSKSKQDKNFEKKYLFSNPIKRMAKPIDIAFAALFFSLDNSSYITGVNLPVDGGRLSV